LIKNVCQIEQNVRHRYPRPSLGRPPRNCWAEGARRHTTSFDGGRRQLGE
jgi:hypothetical protein